MRRRSAESGFTMIELLVAMLLSSIVMAITITAFVSLLDEDRSVNEQNEAQQAIRTSMDRMARELRNLASPVALRNVRENRPRSIEKATAFDLVARIVDDKPIPAGSLNVANVMRVRWCLNTADPANGIVYSQTMRWTTATPPAFADPGTCPATGGGWSAAASGGQHVVNAIDPARPRPLFGFNSTDPEKIGKVHVSAFVDPSPGRRPTEVRLSSGVLLRNQNQFPVAAFEIVPLGTSGTNTNLRFDGSTSSDPEGQTLRYCWFVDPPTPLPDCGADPSFKGEGVVIGYSMPPGTHRVVLLVEDPAGLRHTKETTWP